jgi:hypothetical protein
VQKRRKERKIKKDEKNLNINGCTSEFFKSRSNVKESWSEIWRDYIRLWGISIPKIKRKQICFVGVMEFWIFWPKGGFFIIFSSFEPFWIYRFERLYIIRKYTYGENFKLFGRVLKEIWGFGISILI